MPEHNPTGMNQVTAPIDLALRMAEEQQSSILSRILGPERQQRHAQLYGQPAEPVIEQIVAEMDQEV
jgi:hypothetical protein